MESAYAMVRRANKVAKIVVKRIMPVVMPVMKVS